MSQSARGVIGVESDEVAPFRLVLIDGVTGCDNQKVLAGHDINAGDLANEVASVAVESEQSDTGRSSTVELQVRSDRSVADGLQERLKSWLDNKKTSLEQVARSARESEDIRTSETLRNWEQELSVLERNWSHEASLPATPDSQQRVGFRAARIRRVIVVVVGLAALLLITPILVAQMSGNEPSETVVEDDPSEPHSRTWLDRMKRSISPSAPEPGVPALPTATRLADLSGIVGIDDPPPVNPSDKSRAERYRDCLRRFAEITDPNQLARIDEEINNQSDESQQDMPSDLERLRIGFETKLNLLLPNLNNDAPDDASSSESSAEIWNWDGLLDSNSEGQRRLLVLFNERLTHIDENPLPEFRRLAFEIRDRSESEFRELWEDQVLFQKEVGTYEQDVKTLLGRLSDRNDSQREDRDQTGHRFATTDDYALLESVWPDVLSPDGRVHLRNAVERVTEGRSGIYEDYRELLNLIEETAPADHNEGRAGMSRTE